MYVGIDVSKKTLDVKSTSWSSCERYQNELAGIEKLAKRLKAEKPDLVVMEATGGYERAAAKALQGAGIAVAVVNPWQTHNYAKGLGRRAKTDPIDATILSQFAEGVKPTARPVLSDEEFELKQLVLRRQQLVWQKVAEKNRLEHASKLVSKSIQRIIKALSQENKQITAKIAELIGANESKTDKAAILLSAKGIGKISAYSLCILVPEIGELTRKRIAALVGVAPFNRDSGNHNGPRSIAGGRAEVRTALYMATLTAIRCNTKIKNFYKRLLRRGKKKMVALVACMRKFLVCLNAMVKTKQTWKCVNA